MIVTELVTLACLCMAVTAVSFSKTYRILAGESISKTELEMDGVAKLTDMFISADIDYNYCGQPPSLHIVNQVYLTQLNSQLQDCVSSVNCEPLTWSPEHLLEVKCLSTDKISNATAIDLVCNYEIEYTTQHVMSVGSLTMNVKDVKDTCSKGQVAKVTQFYTRGLGRALLNCSDSQLKQSANFISDLINSCNSPCQSFTLSQTESYGCTDVVGYQHFNNLTSSAQTESIIAFYRCLLDEDGTSTTVTTTPTHRVLSHSQWKPAAIIFILLFCFAVAAAVGMLVYYCRFIRRQGKFPALETNNNEQNAINQQTQPVGTKIKPYALHSLVRADKQSATSNQTDSYDYVVDDRNTMMANNQGLALGAFTTENTYEAVGSPVSPTAPTMEEDYVDVELRTKSIRPNFLSVKSNEGGAPNDRASVCSYVVFEE